MRSCSRGSIDRSAVDDRLDLVARQRLIFKQRLGERLQLVAELLEDRFRTLVAGFDDAADFVRELARRKLGRIDRLEFDRPFGHAALDIEADALFGMITAIVLVAAFNIAKGTLVAWNPDANGTVRAIQVIGACRRRC